MTVDYVREFSGGTFKAVLAAIMPALLAGCIVSLAVYFVRAVTQTRQSGLAVAPKIAATIFCLFLFFPWVARVLMTFITNIVLNTSIQVW